MRRGELRILQSLLAGTTGPLPGLRSQLGAIRVVRRTATEWGPWIDFWVPPTTPRVTPTHFDFGDVHLDFEDWDGGGSAVLFVHDGALASLEIISNVGAVPLDFRPRRIRYSRMLESEDPEGLPTFVTVDRRSLDQLREVIEEARNREAEQPGT